MFKLSKRFKLDCRPFTYGFYCTQTCNCSKDTSDGCDAKTGKCRCTSGFQGDRCEMSKKNYKLIIEFFVIFFKACSPGQWGDDCVNKCDCNGSSCNSQTGVCTCLPGRMGSRCEQSINSKF